MKNSKEYSYLGLREDSIVQFYSFIGELFKTIKILDLLENILFIFYSDNGSILNDSYKDISHQKNELHNPLWKYNGGESEIFVECTKTSFITYCKNKISPGIDDELVFSIELLASLKT